MAEDLPGKDYRAEFGELGLEKVRVALLTRRWPPEKLSAARIWVEKEDAQRWLSARGDEAPRVRRPGIPKWVKYAVIGFGVAFAAARLLKTLRWG